jgi:Uma2 family endonuclease
MIQSISKLISFDEFLAVKPEIGRYELHNGVIVEMPNPNRVRTIMVNCSRLFATIGKLPLHNSILPVCNER